MPSHSIECLVAQAFYRFPSHSIECLIPHIARNIYVTNDNHISKHFLLKSLAAQINYLNLNFYVNIYALNFPRHFAEALQLKLSCIDWEDIHRLIFNR